MTSDREEWPQDKIICDQVSQIERMSYEIERLEKLLVNQNYIDPDVDGIVFVTHITNGLVTGFRWFYDKPNKIGFRMKTENFTGKYQLSNGH